MFINSPSSMAGSILRWVRAWRFSPILNDRYPQLVWEESSSSPRSASGSAIRLEREADSTCRRSGMAEEPSPDELPPRASLKPFTA